MANTDEVISNDMTCARDWEKVCYIFPAGDLLDKNLDKQLVKSLYFCFRFIFGVIRRGRPWSGP